MSAKKNIGQGHDDDPFYRYKRDTIQLKYDNSNGITTHLINLETISLQIKSPLDVLCRYIQKSMGLNKMNHNKIQGRLLPDQVDNNIDKFIEKYLICSKCSMPEWDYKNKQCKACGHYELITTVIADTVDIPKEVEKEKEYDTEISLYLNRLYDRRDRLIRFKKKLNNVNSYIDKCWRCDTRQKWDSLKNKIDVYLI